jgi:hypothetical protein
LCRAFVHPNAGNPQAAQEDKKMAGTVEKRLAELGIVLPEPVAPVAN